MSDRGIRHFCLNTVYFPYRSRKRDPVAGSGIRSGQILHNQIARAPDLPCVQGVRGPR